jgi:tetratricopeptide (TPR) repeat protein
MSKRKIKKLYKIGLKFYSFKYYNEAIEIFDEVLKKDPTIYDVWNQKGVALDKLGKHEEALKAYEQAIKIDPKQTKAIYNKGLTLKDLQRYDEALKSFDEVLNIDITNLHAHLEKGIIYDLLGNYPEAIKRYETILSIKPKDNLVRSMLNKVLEKNPEFSSAWKDRIKSD